MLNPQTAPDLCHQCENMCEWSEILAEQTDFIFLRSFFGICVLIDHEDKKSAVYSENHFWPISPFKLIKIEVCAGAGALMCSKVFHSYSAIWFVRSRFKWLVMNIFSAIIEPSMLNCAQCWLFSYF